MGDSPCLSPVSACSSEAFGDVYGTPNDFGSDSLGQIGSPAAPGGDEVSVEGGPTPTGRRTPSSLSKPPAPARRRSDFDAVAAPSHALQARAGATALVGGASSSPPPVLSAEEPGVYGAGFEPAAFFPEGLTEERPMLGSDAHKGLCHGVGSDSSRSVLYSLSEGPPSPDAATTGLLVGGDSDSALSPDERESSYFFRDSFHADPPAHTPSPEPRSRCSPARLRRLDRSPSRTSSPFKRAHAHPPRRHSLSGRYSVTPGEPVPLRRRQDSFSNPDQEPPISRPLSPALRASFGSAGSAGSPGGDTLEQGAARPPACAVASCSADCLSPPVASYEQELLVAVRKFNLKPRDGVSYLQQRGFLRGEAPAIAHFLRSTRGLSKRKLGDYIGDRGEPNEKVLGEYVRLFDFAGLSFVAAIRAFLTPFRLPGEAQKIDRIMCEFASHYASQNPGVFSNADTAYVLGFSVIMLNTDAHSVQIKTKNRMTKAEFVRNNRGIDSGSDLPVSLLESVYDDIQNDEIRTGMSHDDMGELELLEFFKQGSCFKKYNHARLAADRYHSCRLWIAAHELRYQNLAARNKKEKSIPLSSIEGVLVGPASEVFRRNGVSTQSADALGCFSLVCGGRTLDLQASTPEELEIWTHFFQQVVERSRLDQHARRVALRGQPREAFLLTASDVWQTEILPSWDSARPQPRTRMLWWEGVPPTVRTQLWRLAIGEHTGLSYEAARAEARPVDRAAALARLRREIAIPMQAAAAASPASPTSPGVPVDFNLFTAEDSPMHTALLALLAALEAAARGGGPRMGEHAALLAAALMLYLEPPAAFGCMCTLLDSHFMGKMSDGSSHSLWRMRAARAAVHREMPALMDHLDRLGVETDDFLPAWLGSLFLSTLALDTAARVWDCYLRDGEALVWQVALELLRILSPTLLQQTTPDAALAILHRASAAGATEKALFTALAAGDAALHELLRNEFSQKLPMPPPDRGPVFDLWCNSFDAEEEAGARQAHVGGLRNADGTRAARLLSDDAGSETPPPAVNGEPRGAFGAQPPAGGAVAADGSRGFLGPIEAWLRAKWEDRGA